MTKVKFLILGAGVAGLTFARKLKDCGEDDFLILEKEEEPGGLCRSTEVDGSPFDIGGGHFLDVRRPKVNEFLFRFLPESEWNLYERDSRIELGQMTISHPFEANIWQMDMESQVIYLKSISQAGCNRNEPMPEKFIDWIRWKLGEKIADDYMIPYNQKMFADELNELGTYWLEKLPNVSFEETLRSCLAHKPYGTQPGHAKFYYPKEYGYGEVWNRIADSISEHLFCGEKVTSLDCERRQIKTSSGKEYEADVIVTSIPWNEFLRITGMPEDIVQSVRELKHSSIETRYVPENLDAEAQWIYIPDGKVPYHRILVRHNFCTAGKGYWLETRKERCGSYMGDNNFHYMNEYAYPLNTVSKPQIMGKLLTFTKSKNIYGLGRWGEHCHYNSDVVAERAMKLAEELVNEVDLCIG